MCVLSGHKWAVRRLGAEAGERAGDRGREQGGRDDDGSGGGLADVDANRVMPVDIGYGWARGLMRYGRALQKGA